MMLPHLRHRFNPLVSVSGRYDYSYRNPFLSVRISVNCYDHSYQSSGASSAITELLRFYQLPLQYSLTQLTLCF